MKELDNWTPGLKEKVLEWDKQVKSMQAERRRLESLIDQTVGKIQGVCELHGISQKDLDEVLQGG